MENCVNVVARALENKRSVGYSLLWVIAKVGGIQSRQGTKARVLTRRGRVMMMMDDGRGSVMLETEMFGDADPRRRSLAR